MIEKEENRLTVPVNRLSAFMTRVKEMNSKISKIGGSAVSCSVVREFKEKVKFADGEEYSVPFVEIELTAEPFGLNGWIFIARLEHHDSGRVSIYTAPGQELPADERWQHAKSDCDHCNKQIFRSNTYVFKNESGEYKQVGSSCLKDFFKTDPKQALRWFTYIRTILEDSEGDYTRDFMFRGSKDSIYTERYLQLVAVGIRKHGWVSKSASASYSEKSGGFAHLTCTAVEAANAYFTLNKEVIDEFKIEGVDREVVKSALEWLNAEITPKKNKTNFEHNLSGACNAEFISWNEVGVVASLISCYSKAIEKNIARRKAQETDGGFLGSVGERIKISGTVSMVKSLGFGDFGERFLVKIITDNNNAIVWFGNGKAIGELIIGEKVEAKATVKAHEMYNGLSQTVVTRFAIV